MNTTIHCMYTLNDRNVWYGNCNSIKLLKRSLKIQEQKLFFVDFYLADFPTCCFDQWPHSSKTGQSLFQPPLLPWSHCLHFLGWYLLVLSLSWPSSKGPAKLPLCEAFSDDFSLSSSSLNIYRTSFDSWVSIGLFVLFSDCSWVHCLPNWVACSFRARAMGPLPSGPWVPGWELGM